MNRFATENILLICFHLYFIFRNHFQGDDKMTKRLNVEYVKEKIESTNYYFLNSDNYINNSEKLEIEDINGYKYFYGFSHILHHIFGNGTGLEPFNVSNAFTSYNISVWLNKNKSEIHYIDGEYIGAYDKTLYFECDRCGDKFYSSWNYISNKKRYNCPICGGKIAGKYNNLKVTRPKLIMEWNFIKNKMPPESFLPNSHEYASWICLKCGHKWDATIKSRAIKNGSGCPKCDESKGEKIISDFLNCNNIKYLQEFVIPKCKYKRVLPFDFCLTDYGILIEYDGIIHFIDKFNNPEEFELTKLRDSIKTQFCIDNNITLIRIPYWDFNNIESILESELSQYVN